MTFRYLDKVEIRDPKTHKGKFFGRVAQVMKLPIHEFGDVAVRIYGEPDNPKSRYGFYWFPQSCLFKVDEETFKVSAIDTTPLANRNESKYDFPLTASVSFKGNQSRKYYYACYDKSIEAGDIVNVMTGHHGVAIAKVCDIYSDEDKKALVEFSREIISKVDSTEYTKRKKAREQREKLRREIEAYFDTHKVEFCEILAATKNIPELKNLIRDYRKIGGKDF